MDCHKQAWFILALLYTLQPSKPIRGKVNTTHNLVAAVSHDSDNSLVFTLPSLVIAQNMISQKLDGNSSGFQK